MDYDYIINIIINTALRLFDIACTVEFYYDKLQVKYSKLRTVFLISSFMEW